MSDTKNVSGMVEYPKEGILSMDLFRSKSSNTSLFCMAAGSEMEDHTSTKEGIVHIIEGKGTFVLEGKEIPMLPGTVIRMEKNAVHRLSAEENTCFMLHLHK